MKKSIEAIWEEGFLKENSLVVPKINDLYNRKSKHLVDKIKRLFKINMVITIVMAILFPIIFYFLDALWQGAATAIVLLLAGWYSLSQIRGIKTLEMGETSLDYLKAFERWLEDMLSRSEKVARFYYPLCFLIAVSTIWSAWNKQKDLIVEIHQKFPDAVFIGNIPLVALIVLGVATLLMFWFSDKIYKLDLRLMYGGVFGKLKETIAEMEKLKQEL